jgi:hypothetical protein
MKVISRSAVFAWTPKHIQQASNTNIDSHSEGLVCGSGAQQLDASFNSGSRLEFCSTNQLFDTTTLDMNPERSVAVNHRFVFDFNYDNGSNRAYFKTYPDAKRLFNTSILCLSISNG